MRGRASAEADRRKAEEAEGQGSQPGARTGTEPILTADELRALLQESPGRPSVGVESAVEMNVSTGFEPVEKKGRHGLPARVTCMVRLATERVLLVGDAQRQVHCTGLEKAVQGVEVTSVPTYFDAIAELAEHRYTAVLASAEPIERRPEAAVKTLRRLAGDARLLLFGHPTLEPLSRKMMEFGCDDYLITPAEPGELQQVFSAPRMRIAPAEPVAASSATEAEVEAAGAGGSPLVACRWRICSCGRSRSSPMTPPAEAVRRLNAHLRPDDERDDDGDFGAGT